MTAVRTILALFFAALVCVAFSYAGEGHEKKLIKLVLTEDSEPVEVDISDLKVGESRQVIDQEGHEVVVTHLEDGLEVTVDGEAIELPMAGHHGAREAHEAHPAGHRKVIVQRIEGGEAVDVDVDLDMSTEMHEVHGLAGHPQVIVRRHENAAKRLIDSGVLEQLEPEVREQILEALRQETDGGDDSSSEIVIVEKRVSKKKSED